MRLVIIESPYAGSTPEELARNVAYTRRALRDSLIRGESPLASHLLFTQPGVLRDEVPEERRLGILAGLAWSKVAHAAVIYADLGITPGMMEGSKHHQNNGTSIEYRQIGLPRNWFLHVWAYDAYAGAYDHCTEAEAIADLEDRKASGLANIGYRYQISNSQDEPGRTDCSTCSKANKTCPVYPQDWLNCGQHQVT